MMFFSNRLKPRGLYAIHSGDRAGGFIVHIKEENRGNSYAVLFMPSPMESLYLSREEVKADLKFGNLKFVHKLPKEVYEVCKANFIYYAKKAGIYVNR